MKIQIDENWSVEADAASWNLSYRKEGDLNDKGVPKVSQSVSYHARLVDALKYYLNEVPTEAGTLEAVITAWDGACTRVEKACQGISKPRP